jgi:hypothetical protein
VLSARASSAMVFEQISRSMQTEVVAALNDIIFQDAITSPGYSPDDR